MRFGKKLLAALMICVCMSANVLPAMAATELACYSTWRDIDQHNGTWVTKSCLAIHSPGWQPQGNQLTIKYAGNTITQGPDTVEIILLDFTPNDDWYYYGIATRFRILHPNWDTDSNWKVYRN